MVFNIFGIDTTYRNITLTDTTLTNPKIEGTITGSNSYFTNINANAANILGKAGLTSNNSMSGVNTFSDSAIISGSNGKISFLNSENNEAMITFDTAEKLNWYNDDSTKRMTLDSTGKLGIGTDSPSYLLEVEGGHFALGTHNKAIYGKTSSGAFEPAIWLRGTNDNMYIDYGAGGLYVRKQSSNSNISMRIDSNGNVGIGTDTPLYLLDVDGASQIQGSGANPFIIDTRGSYVSGLLGFGYKYITDNNTITYTGNTSSNDYYSPCGIMMGYFDSFQATNPKSYAGIGFVIGDPGDGDVNPNAVLKMLITKQGRVGIGETTPDSLLHVKGGDGSTANGITIERSDTSAQGKLYMSSDYLNLVSSSSGVVLKEETGNKDVFLRSTGFYPGGNNTTSLGKSGNRWTQLFAISSTISTSDANKKKDVCESDLGLRFINRLKTVSYLLKDKGERTHYGLIAQDVGKALQEENKEFIGKETKGFAGYCYDKAITEADVEKMKTVKVMIEKQEKDTSGNTVYEEVEKEVETNWKDDIREEEYGLRYEEFIAPMIKAIQELSKEVEALKQQ